MNTPSRTKTIVLFVTIVAVFVVILAVYWQPPQLVTRALQIAREGAVFTVTDLAITDSPADEHPGTFAPDFQLTHANDSYWLHDFRGGVVVLNLMATRCVYCRLEISHLQDVWETYAAEVVVVTVDVDPTESAGTLSAFAQEFRDASWIWALDRSNLALAYGASFIPKTVIIDQDGYIQFTHTGVVQPAVLTQEIDHLLTLQGE